MRLKRILVLFPNSWDKRHLSHPKYRGRFEFIFYDRELWTFPRGFLRILRFDPIEYIDRIVQDCARLRIDGILSTDEYLGAILAAAVAKRLGLPGHDPAVMIRASHKYYARLAQRQLEPDAVPDFQLMSVPAPRREQLELKFPIFVKPVRGSFSIFAARCNSYLSLQRHLRLNAIWRFGLRRVLRPFNDLMRHFTGYRVDVNHFIGESFMRGHQVCLDGFVQNGQVTFLGVVDALFFPGTHTFERFVYPSRLPYRVHERMRQLCRRMVLGLGMSHGQFNVELFWDPVGDTLRVIELHPRISYQFSDLYEDVDGANTYDILVDLTVGNEPRVPRAAGRHKHAASLVMRKFQGHWVRNTPSVRSLDAFRSRHPDARVQIFAKRGSMNPEMRAMGSYRCALINTGANSLDQLCAIRADADATLHFDVI